MKWSVPEGISEEEDRITPVLALWNTSESVTAWSTQVSMSATVAVMRAEEREKELNGAKN